MDDSERFEIEFPPERVTSVHAQLGGAAPSPDKVGNDVRHLVRRDQLQPQTYKNTIRQKIAEGMRSLRADEGVDGESFMENMDRELADLESQG